MEIIRLLYRILEGVHSLTQYFTSTNQGMTLWFPRAQASLKSRVTHSKRGGRSLARRIGVANRDYHYLSHLEIDGGKRIYQHLSKCDIPRRRFLNFLGKQVYQ
jgi:hypothetical protein